MRTEKAVGPDPLGGRLGDRRHGDRVVVGAGSQPHQLLQQRVGDVAQLEQADVRDDPERLLDERQASGDQEPGHQAPAGRPPLRG